jgi:hypothetical protein
LKSTLRGCEAKSPDDVGLRNVKNGRSIMINARDVHEPEDERLPQEDEEVTENDDLESEEEELDEEEGDD